MWTLHDGRGHLLPWGWAAAWLWRVAIQRICNPHIKPALHSLVFLATFPTLQHFDAANSDRSLFAFCMHDHQLAAPHQSRPFHDYWNHIKTPRRVLFGGAHLVSGSEHQICTIYHMCYTTTSLSPHTQLLIATLTLGKKLHQSAASRGESRRLNLTAAGRSMAFFFRM